MEIRPFRGWRYSGDAGDVSSYIAPPYDVLNQQDKDNLLSRSEQNIVAVDMPYVPPKELGPEEVYRQAAERLKQWQADGVLVQDDRPAIYAYEQTYSWAGKTYSRRAMLCGVRATALGEDVIPHEHTFAGPKADRLRLTECTGVQLSPIFGFFDDAGGVSETLWSAARGAPTIQGKLRDVHEKLWVIDDEAVIAKIAAALADRPVFIADGHHRYTTAMNYATELRKSGRIDEKHEANFVMFCLVARSDPGLLVLPTHRMVRGLKEGFSVEALAESLPEFTWKRCSVDEANLADADAFLRKYGSGAMAFIGAHPAEIWVGRLNDPKAMAELAPDECEEWRRLDVAILHRLVIDKALAAWKTDQTALEYTPDGRAVMAACKAGSIDLGVCMQGTPLEAVEAIANRGASMPHKSTYFYPKLATGMVIKPLELGTGD